MEKEAEWIPLESNPEVMNAFLRELGLTKGYSIHDVFGTDPELLAMIPRPVVGLILLFPITAADSKGTVATMMENCPGSDSVYYMKQKISNACGTIALIHLVANNPVLQFGNDSVLDHFLKNSSSLDPEARGKALALDEKFRQAHDRVAHQGQTAAPSQGEAQNVDLHFVALVPKDGKIWELDGRKSGPVCHGDTNAESFLEDGIKVCKAFIAARPEENRFTIVALAKDWD